MEDFLAVVCCRNTAIGIYPSMDFARKAILDQFPDAEWVSSSPTFIEYICHFGPITAVMVRPSGDVSPLIRPE
jgi:hypothetical protein